MGSSTVQVGFDLTARFEYLKKKKKKKKEKKETYALKQISSWTKYIYIQARHKHFAKRRWYFEA